MAIVSIKRYLDTWGGIDETSLRQVVAQLVARLGECAVDCDPQETESVRQEIREIHESLTPDLPDESFGILAISAAQALEKYNKRSGRILGKQATAYRTIARALVDSLMRIAGDQTESAQSLVRIDEELERGAAFVDLQSLKQHLDMSLHALGAAVESEKTASKAMIDKLRIEMETYRKAQVEPEADPATGALLKEDCVTAIQQAIDKGTPLYIVVMVVNHVQPINARFGRDAGDWILLRFKEHVEHHLFPSDHLFRWTGPAMVALLERPEGAAYVRALVTRMLDARLEVTYRVGARLVLIPISAAWSTFPVTANAESLQEQIETFIAAQGGGDSYPANAAKSKSLNN
jgi:GGDEF domain-containing protein